MSFFATALQKVENKFNKNTTPYFYLYVVIIPQKSRKMPWRKHKHLLRG